MSGSSHKPSSHPIDILIRDLIATGWQPAPEEVDQIVHRMATAPFNTDFVRVQVKYRGLACQGVELGRFQDSFTFHWVRRIVVDEQWAIGTTRQEFLSDARRVPLTPNARLLAYNRWGRNFVAAVGSTVNVVPFERLGTGAESLILQVYSADWAHIRTAYMASGYETLNLPRSILWIR